MTVNITAMKLIGVITQECCPQMLRAPLEPAEAEDMAAALKVIADPARLRLVSGEGLGGLVASAPPSLDSIPNNHLFYAAQWFFIAAAALVIYVLALRKRLKAEDA